MASEGLRRLSRDLAWRLELSKLYFLTLSAMPLGFLSIDPADRDVSEPLFCCSLQGAFLTFYSLLFIHSLVWNSGLVTCMGTSRF